MRLLDDLSTRWRQHGEGRRSRTSFDSAPYASKIRRSCPKTVDLQCISATKTDKNSTYGSSKV